MGELVSSFNTIKSGIAHLIAVKGGVRIASGSGFLVDGYIVTCAHVIRDIKEDHDLVVRFSHDNDIGENKNFNFSFQIMMNSIRGFSEENSYDFAILDLPIEAERRYNFVFKDEDAKVGLGVAALGYPFESEHLSLHSGIVSSCFKSGPATTLQVDMSVNPSNSGGPLIDSNTSEVVGVIARKATGLSRLFDQLIEGFDRNIESFKGRGGIIMGNVDFMGSLRNTQIQMKQIALEMRRSANVGIGYAISSDPLRYERVFGR